MDGFSHPETCICFPIVKGKPQSTKEEARSAKGQGSCHCRGKASSLRDSNAIQSFCVCLFVFVTGSHYVVEIDLELTM